MSKILMTDDMKDMAPNISVISSHVKFSNTWRTQHVIYPAGALTMIRNNTSKAVVVFGLCAFVIYLVWTYVALAQRNQAPAMHAWKVVERIEKIPDDVWKRAEEVSVEKESVNVHVHGGQDIKTVIRVANSYDQHIKRTPVLLLHGAAFSSKTWHDLKTLQLIGAMGHKAVAIDLPGYGQSEAAGEFDRAKYMRALIEQLDIPHPVLVTASMSGRYVIPYVMADSPGKAWQRATALIAIAPVNTKSYTHQQYARLEIPVLILRGEKDTQLGLEASSSLQNAQSNKYVEFPSAGHACYMNDPDRWHLELYNFLRGVESMKLQELAHS